MANLYDINQEILSCIDLETGEIIDIEKFDQLQLDKNEKIENVALYYKNLLSDAAAFKAEKDVFADKQKRAEAKAESLKQYIDSALHGSKLETTKVNVSYRKSTSVDVLDVDSLPAKYRNEVTTVSANKAEIGKALKAGEAVAGAKLVESQNIQIK